LDVLFNRIFAKYSLDIQNLANDLNQFILTEIDGIKTIIDQKSWIVAFGFANTYTDTLFTIIPSKKQLKLCIAYGSKLKDEFNLFKGEGKTHKHIVINSKKDLDIRFKSVLNSAYKSYCKRVGINIYY
jgi:hypothetical protein